MSMGPTEVQRAPVHNGLTFKQPALNYGFDATDSPADTPGSRQSPSVENNLTSTDFSAASRRALRSEALRLATFNAWPHEFLSSNALAAAGFFYRGQGDQAQCAFCLIIISHWEPSDEPLSEHKRHAPNCPFIKGLPVGNIPLNEPMLPSTSAPPIASLPIPNFAAHGFDTCLRHTHEFRPNANPEQGNSSRDTVQDEEPVLGGSAVPSVAGVHVHQKAKRPDLATLESRLKTFRDWPLGLAQRPAQLAEAGFYYMKTGDHVQCFCCDGALRNWEPNDDPWVEHARWFSRCNFLLSTKGADYVSAIQKKYKEEEMGCGSETPQKEAQPLSGTLDSETKSSVAEASTELRKGGQDLKDALMCKICYDQLMSMVFLPCGHSLTCPSCAAALSNCPLCRKPIEATVKAYFSFS